MLQSRKEIVFEKKFQELLTKGGKIYFQTHFIPLLQMQGEAVEINMKLVGKESTQIPALINAKRVDNSARNTIYRLTILDITQRKQYEKELLLARKEAEDKAQKLKQINEELERFAHQASHDLQAPLNTLTGIVYMLEENDYIKNNTEVCELVSKIKSNTQQMRQMIRDLLEYSKMEGKSDFESISLNNALNKALEMLDQDIQSSDAVIKSSKLPVILGAESQIIRLFQKLISNAIKYRSEDDPVISIDSEKTNGFHTINISDNGIGIELKDKGKIFGFMERLHSNDEIEGSGLGLSTCQRIVENHGGEIGATSEPDTGSRFYFTLPVQF